MAIINVPTDQATIQDAIAAASPGDTIVVDPSYTGPETATVSVDGLTFDISAASNNIILNLSGVSAVDLINNGDVTINGSTSAETITAGTGHNTIDAGLGADVVYGGAGNDQLVNTAGAASLYGGIGNDTLEASGSASQELLFGSSGNDTFRYTDASGNYAPDFIFGGFGGQDRVLIQGTADGQVFDLVSLEVTDIEEVEFAAIGSNRDITLILEVDEFNTNGAEFANDLLIDGNNVSGSTEILRVDLNDSATEDELDFSGWTFTGWGGQGERVEIIGSGRDETITGTSMSDSIVGGAGNDTITDINGGSSVTLLGGTGIDRLDLSGSTAGWNINTTGTGNNASSGLTIGRIDEFEHITASDFDDIITGDADLSILYGGDGNDQLINTAGAASLYGGIGNDTLEASGSASQEFLFGLSGNDTFRYTNASGDYTPDFIFGGFGGQDRVLIQGTTDGQVFDLVSLEVTDIEEVEFAAIGSNRDITLILEVDEFNANGAEFANNLLIDGNNVSGSTEILRVDLNDSATEDELDFSGLDVHRMGRPGRTC